MIEFKITAPCCTSPLPYTERPPLQFETHHHCSSWWCLGQTCLFCLHQITFSVELLARSYQGIRNTFLFVACVHIGKLCEANNHIYTNSASKFNKCLEQFKSHCTTTDHPRFESHFCHTCSHMPCSQRTGSVDILLFFHSFVSLHTLSPTPDWHIRTRSCQTSWTYREPS